MTAGNAAGRTTAPPSAWYHAGAAAELGLQPLARLARWAVAGVPPATWASARCRRPRPRSPRRPRAGDIDLIELNEAFAAQVLGREPRMGLRATADFERLNVNGSGISLGHPVGATGGRILATLLREMRRRDARYGLETMCIGGGQGLAAVFERVGK